VTEERISNLIITGIEKISDKDSGSGWPKNGDLIQIYNPESSENEFELTTVSLSNVLMSYHLLSISPALFLDHAQNP
jgi:hypothetical protein